MGAGHVRTAVLRPSLSVGELAVLDGSVRSVDPLTRNEEDRVVEVVTQCIDAPDSSRDCSRRRGRIAGEDARVCLGSQLLLRASEVGILARNDAVGVPGVFEKRPVFGSRDEIVADDRDVIADSLRDIALDVTIEYGPAVELLILSEATFDRYQREGNPFIRNVVAGGESYA